MPQTPVFGLPFEEEPDQPGITLNGGEFGTEDILAEAVEAALLGLDASIQSNTADIATLEARVDALEAGTTIPGWTPIQSGNSTGASFDIDLTDGGRFAVGEFALVRLFMRYDLSALSGVNLQINADAGGNAYMWGMRQLDAANPAGDLTAFPISRTALGIDDLVHQTATGSWRIGLGSTVSTNNLVCTLFHMNGNVLHSFQATSNRQSTSATTHAEATAWGALTSLLSAVPSTLRLVAANFVDAWWWAEGYRVP
jgi:hypothetical protein